MLAAAIQKLGEAKREELEGEKREDIKKLSSRGVRPISRAPLMYVTPSSSTFRNRKRVENTANQMPLSRGTVGINSTSLLHRVVCA